MPSGFPVVVLFKRKKPAVDLSDTFFLTTVVYIRKDQKVFPFRQTSCTGLQCVNNLSRLAMNRDHSSGFHQFCHKRRKRPSNYFYQDPWNFKTFGKCIRNIVLAAKLLVKKNIQRP